MKLKPNNSYEEKELLRYISEGDESAFEVIFNRYSKLLYSFLYRHTDDVHLADDLVQDVFTKVWLTRESVAHIENFAAYLFVMARNHALNIIQKRIRDRKREMNWHLMIDQIDDNESRQPFLDLIDQAVAKLPQQQYKTWMMSRRQGMKYAEIATALGISRETVKTHLQHANNAITKHVLANASLAILFLLIKIQ